MPGLIPTILGAVIRFFTGGKQQAPELQETASSGISSLASSLEPGDGPALQEKGLDLSRWQVTECREAPFLKTGRLFVANGTLVIRSDLDGRGYSITLDDVAALLDGEPVPVTFLDTGTPAGTARLSASGKAVNIRVDPVLYTVPRARVLDVIQGKARKAAGFAGREDAFSLHLGESGR